MKRLFIFTYPKLTLYVLAIIGAYFVFQIPAIVAFITDLDVLIYLAVFFGGLLYSAGFTTPIATGFFLALQVPLPIIAALVGGVGALLADLGIFSFIRLSLMDEFNRLEHSSFIRHLVSGVRSIVPQRLRTWLVYIFVAVIIASPLPDEVGVALLAGFTKVHPLGFMAISYLGNVAGIYVLLMLG